MTQLQKILADFIASSKAGRELADWHMNYETSAMHPDIVAEVAADCIRHANHGKGGAWRMQSAATFRAVQMKSAKTKGPETNKSVPDKTTAICNLPLEADECVVNGKPALERFMERQSVTSGANLRATQTMNNPAYPPELFLRVAKVAAETVGIVKGAARTGD